MRLPIVLLVVAAATATAWTFRARGADEQAEQRKSAPREGRPGGWVSSGRCLPCHPDEHASWHRSFHRTMTRYASPDAALGDFGGVQLESGLDSARLFRVGDELHAEVPDPLASETLDPTRLVDRRVQLITGSHHMQVYWVPTQRGNEMASVQFSWLVEDRRWVPRRDVFLYPPSWPRAVQRWNDNCAYCHSTGPMPRISSDDHADTQVAELGIACEACHGPGEEHVLANINPLRRYRLHLGGGPDETIVNPRRLDAVASSQLCGQCHAVTDKLDLSYRPGADLFASSPLVRPSQPTHLLESHIQDEADYLRHRFWSDGTIRVSGRDYNGLIESTCYKKGALSCIRCHSMHRSEPDLQLAASMDGDDACLGCHQSLRGSAHTHHKADSPGSRCYNCHMPYTVYGLLRAIRNHQIDSPRVRPDGDRPNACNLCHLDRSLGWTDEQLSRWYRTPRATLSDEQRSIAASVLWLATGDAILRAVVAWHFGWAPARQASSESWMPLHLAPLLDDPYAAVRYVASHALAKLDRFRGLVFDYIGPEDERKRAAADALARFRKGPPPVGNEALLIDEHGAPRQDRIDALRRRRDDTELAAVE
jgi:predicted CXXCH cytochrome family protein